MAIGRPRQSHNARAPLTLAYCLRRQLNLTQRIVQDISGLHPELLMSIERGRVPARLDDLKRLAEIYGYTGDPQKLLEPVVPVLASEMATR